MIIFDRYGRPLENLRIIVTTKCNYNCIFCHSEGYYHCIREDTCDLYPKDIKLIALVAKRFGINQVKITGGEPLIRDDICEVVSIFEDLDYKDISMATNGFLLLDYADKLAESGLNRINVNIPSLVDGKYDHITGTKGRLGRVLRGLEAAKDAGIGPIKINVVILKGINDNEWRDFIEFAEKMSVNIQFIEFHTKDPQSEKFVRFYRSIDPIEQYLKEIASKVDVRKMNHRKRYKLETGIDVEVVRPMFNPEFCRYCHRIRATPTGWKPCLLNDTIVEYGEALRSRDLIGIANKFLMAVAIREPFFK